MAKSILRHAWNAIQSQAEKPFSGWDLGPSQGGPSAPQRQRFFHGADRTIIASIYTRMAVDVALANFNHCRVDDDEQYLSIIKSGLNNCLTLDPNEDQNSQMLFMDLALKLFNQGTAAIVPVDTTLNPDLTGGWDANQIQIGEVVTWYAKHVTVRLWWQEKQTFKDITLEKSFVGLVENPFYEVMNAPNSTLQRLSRALNLLDVTDEKVASGKLDLVVQLPYVVKTDTQVRQAERRRKALETQLADSTYGIGYIDGTEKLTQLNRPVENNLLAKIELLQGTLYSQLGITAGVLDGTASEEVMTNYLRRTIEPICNAAKLEMKRKFLTKTARSQGQSILYFTDPFRFVPLKDLAEIADKLTRNEVVTANEFRALFLKMKPSTDPRANQLQNSNMPVKDLQPGVTAPPASSDPTAAPADGGDAATVDDISSITDDAFGQVNSQLDDVFKSLGAVDDTPALTQ